MAWIMALNSPMRNGPRLDSLVHAFTIRTDFIGKDFSYVPI